MNCPHGKATPDTCPACRLVIAQVAMLRAQLAICSDQDFVGFMNAYAFGTVAGALIEQMGQGARVGFFAQMMQTYDLVTGERRQNTEKGPTS